MSCAVSELLPLRTTTLRYRCTGQPSARCSACRALMPTCPMTSPFVPTRIARTCNNRQESDISGVILVGHSLQHLPRVDAHLPDDLPLGTHQDGTHLRKWEIAMVSIGCPPVWRAPADAKVLLNYFRKKLHKQAVDEREHSAGSNPEGCSFGGTGAGSVGHIRTQSASDAVETTSTKGIALLKSIDAPTRSARRWSASAAGRHWSRISALLSPPAVIHKAALRTVAGTAAP